MIKRFNDTAILTTQNPEVFLNYVYDISSYWIVPTANITSGKLIVNGIDISTYDASLVIYGTNYSLKLDFDVSVASFHVYTHNVSDFDASLIFEIFNDQYCTSLYRIDSVNIYYRPNIIDGDINIYENENTLVDDKTSYLILRTTPELTGNIKLVVDCSNNLFLDTFKVSYELSNRKYRRQQVSANSVYSNDIKNIFSKVPVGDDLYKNDKENTLVINTPKTDILDQYRTTYNYGARLLEDELYKEDNALLAPLWLNSDLPNYFCIFRLPGVYNTETYDGSSLVYLASKYLENSDIIKTWSFRTNTPLGTYFTTHLNDILKYPAPLFLALTDPSIVKSTSDPNTWYGISVDKGVITGKDEDTYVFNKNLYDLTKLNAFVSQGFKRNKLVSSNLINLEYVFDDNDVSTYTMNRYFGLYLTENILYQIAYYSDVSGGTARILSLDGKDNSTFINSRVIFDLSTGLIRSNYKNRLFVLNDEINLNRITNRNELDVSANIIKSYINKPYDHLFDVAVERKDINPFITITLNNKLNPGDALRIINKKQNKIWEVYGVDSSVTCQTYVSRYSTTGYPTIHQTFFLTSGDITDQVESIHNAFNRFQDYESGVFRSAISGDDWFSLVLNDDASLTNDWSFQRLTSQLLNDINNPSSGFNSSASYDDITFFGRFIPEASNYTMINYDASYGPINFEFFGNRNSIEIPLFKRNANYLYSFKNELDALNKFETYTLYQDNNYWYKAVKDFDVSFGKTYAYVQDPLSIETCYLVQTENEIKTIGDRWNAYSIFPLKISLMGINPIKDIDFTVYDSCLGAKSEYFYARENDASTYQLTIEAGQNNTITIRNSYIIKSGTGLLNIGTETRPYAANTVFNTFDKNARIFATSKTSITYAILDGSYNFTSYSTTLKEQDVSFYYDSSALLKYSLTSPTIFSWVGVGTDTRNNQYRLMLNPNILTSNFSPAAKSDTRESTYPVFKYLTPGTRNWEDYVFYDINDTVKYTDASIVYYKTVKDLMLSKPTLDIFSRLIYFNNDIDNVKNRSTVLYYNSYKNSVDTLFLGLKLSIIVNNVAKGSIDIKKYDRYRFCLISTSSKNKGSRKPIDVIINENTKTILMIWYQGNDVLNYYYMNSSYLPGKSLLDASDGENRDYRGFVTRKDASLYSFIKTPFVINNSTLAKWLVNIYDDDVTYDSSLVKPYAQFNYSTYSTHSIWNAYCNNNFISSNIFNTNYSYDTFTQAITYLYHRNSNAFNDYVINYGYKYSCNDNLYTKNTCRVQTLDYLLQNNNMMVYLIKSNETITSNDFASPPISIIINASKQFNNMYTYNGWYKPKFVNILEFKSNEDDTLMSIVGKDFTLCNTNLRAYKNLNQLWYNKVVTTVLTSDVSAGNNIAYATDFNIFKSLWDKNYFKKRDAGLIYQNINGYQCSKELPTFFGSKLPKLPDEISLENWSSDIAYTETDDSYYYLCFNISKALLSLFNSNITFVSNWDGLSVTGDMIDNYIVNTVIPYYYIDPNKMEVTYYKKKYDTRLLYYNYDTNFELNDKQNFYSNLYIVNDEYIFKIRIDKNNNYSYFVKIKLIEK